MESRTPVNILTGVRVGDSRVARCVPQVNITMGGLQGHQVHSTMTVFRIPLYSSAPKRTRTAVFINFFRLYQNGIRAFVKRSGGCRGGSADLGVL